MDKSNHADRARFRPPNKAHARGDRRINRINAEPEFDIGTDHKLRYTDAEFLQWLQTNTNYYGLSSSPADASSDSGVCDAEETAGGNTAVCSAASKSHGVEQNYMYFQFDDIYKSFNEQARRFLNPSLLPSPRSENESNSPHADVCLINATNTAVPTPIYCDDPTLGFGAARVAVGAWTVSPAQHVIEYTGFALLSAFILCCCRIYRKYHIRIHESKDLRQNECMGKDESPPCETMSSALWFKALVLFWFPIVIHSTIGNPFSFLNFSYYRTRPLFMATPCATLWMIAFATIYVVPKVACHDQVRLKHIETPIMHIFLSSIVWPIAALVAESPPLFPPTYKAFVWHGHHISLVSIPFIFLLTGDQFSSLWITPSLQSKPTLKMAAGSYVYWLFFGFAWNMIYFFGIVTPIAIWTGMNLAWTMNPMPPFSGRYYRLELAAEWFVYSASLRLFVCIVEFTLSRTPLRNLWPFDRLANLISIRPNQLWAIVGIAGIAVWISCGTEKASGGEYWIPVPLFGYTRFEIALALLFIQAMMTIAIYVMIPKRFRAQYLMVAFILMPNLLPLLGTEQYIHFTRPLTTGLFRQYGSAPDPSSQTVLSVHGVLDHYETRRLIQFTLKHKELWTKVSQSHALGYFMLGWRNDYFSSTKTIGKTYTLSHGLRLSGLRDPCRETDFSGHCMKENLAISTDIMERGLTKLFQRAYSKVLNTTAENVMLPGGTVGFPLLQIFLPNLLWQFISNPHIDHGTFQDQEDNRYGADLLPIARCNTRAPMKSIIIPLTAPGGGAGLNYWTSLDHRHEVDYEIGSAYIFPTTLVHAIRPFPYRENTRMDNVRITIQAFAAECNDGSWLVTGNPWL